MRNAIILVTFLALTAGAEAQAVNCGSPRGPGQQLVCRDPQLRGMDRRINGHYLRVITIAEPPDYFRLKRSQRPYLAARDSCRSAACLANVFRKRSYELRDVVYE